MRVSPRETIKNHDNRSQNGAGAVFPAKQNVQGLAAGGKLRRRVENNRENTHKPYDRLKEPRIFPMPVARYSE